MSETLTKLRTLLRADETWMAVLAALVGLLGGLGVAVINIITSHMHALLFALPPGRGLSESAHIAPLRALLMPTLGGLALGVSMVVLARQRTHNLIDPVEANALYGGRMSLLDSLIVAAQTAWSNGFGASVGMEAGYAQLGAGVASWLGQALRLRRNDLRVLVGCGAAAAIAGAFNAPLCGAFYGIELIIGSYALATLPYVIIAAVAGTLATQLCGVTPPPLNVILPAIVPASAYGVLIVEGIACGLAGIVIMRGVTLVEAGFRRSGMPVWARPAVGGLAVGALGCVSPAAMSSGHTALHADIGVVFPLTVVLGLLLLKAAASAISLGAGFRGGLFFASLFLGVMFGKAFAVVVGVLPFAPLPPGLYAVVGMSALAAGIVGGPLTMTFLALESTGSFGVTMAVLAATIAATLTVRRLFGYSFTTWRFHLRGTPIVSAEDIGWVSALTVGRMMRAGPMTVAGTMTLADFRRDVPPGAMQRVVVLDDSGRYAGLAYPAEAAVATGERRTVADILHQESQFLLPQMSVRDALAAFKVAEADALAVLRNGESRAVIGVLTESHALRRYNEELERMDEMSRRGRLRGESPG